MRFARSARVDSSQPVVILKKIGASPSGFTTGSRAPTMSRTVPLSLLKSDRIIGSSGLRGFAFECRHFRQTPAMAIRTAETGREERLNELPGSRGADDEAAQADDVEVVVLDALMRRKVLVNQAGPNPCNFVRGD